ncbi:CCA tRNA nucleotidyltransferase [Clostridium botulinum]|nr:CCA tRNA nucleotidyltransferase [Clostridium botulinum]
METNIKIYIIGGAIRDIILNNKINDIDICLEGEPKELIYRMKNIKEYIYYDEFHTSTIKFQNNIQIDLIGCRKEKYEYEGALPKITLSNIKNNLERRDFTINALAYDIVEDKILDFFNGMEDLRKGKIIKIHNNSYMEDGTRIFRAIKYSIRYGFKIEDEKEIRESITKGTLKNISNDRIVSELYSLCTEENWIEAIKQCYKYNLLDIDLNLLGLENILLDYSNIYVRILNVLYSIKGEHGQSIFIDNSFLDKDLRKPIDKYLQNKEIYSLSLSNAKDNYEIYKILSKTYSFERVLLAWNLKFRYKVYNYEKI